MKKILLFSLMLLLVGTLAACGELAELLPSGQEENGPHYIDEETGSHYIDEETGSHYIDEETGSHYIDEETGSHYIDEETGSHYIDEETGSHYREGLAVLDVQYVTDAALRQLASYIEFVDQEEEVPQRIMITANAPLREFRFSEILTVIDENDQVEFIEGRILHSIDLLSPGTAFVVNWAVQGAFQHRGITFIDESGTTRYFYISHHMAARGVELVEFFNRHS